MTREQEIIIATRGTIPWEVMCARLNACARHEGLPGYHCAAPQLISHLAAQRWRIQNPNRPCIDWHQYLEQKYSTYLWEGYTDNHLHEDEYQFAYGLRGQHLNELIADLNRNDR
jgi:hypothetical protein